MIFYSQWQAKHSAQSADKQTNPNRSRQMNRFPYQSMEQLKSKNDRAGYHFFDASSKRFFSSRILSGVFPGADGWYFVTSEQFTMLYVVAGPRLYTVRRMREDGGIDTIGEFQGYKSASIAKNAAKRAAELSMSENATCPTANGSDLELFEQTRN